MLLDFLNELLGRFNIGSSSGKVVYLANGNDFLAINFTDVDVSFVGGVPESHLVDQDISDDPFP